MWNLEGEKVKGMYLNQFPVEGLVELSRVQYGGRVCHTVVLERPLQVYGATRERVILAHSDVTQIVSKH